MGQNNVEIILTAINNAKKELDSIEKQLGGVGDASGKASKDMLGMKDALKTIAVGGAAVGAALFAAKKAFDFAQEGAMLERLGDSGSEMARQLGSSYDEMIGKLDKAAHGTVADADLMLAANKAMMLGLGADADELANLLEVAAFRGRVMGLSTTQAFSDIVTGIGRASPMILDNLGIVLDSEATYGKYAESIGKAASELTKAEKIQALLADTLEVGNEQLATAGGLVEDNADGYGKLTTRVKNAWNDLKILASDGLAPVIDKLNEMAEAQTEENDVFNAFMDAVDDGIITWDQAYSMLDQANEGTISWADALEWLTSVLGEQQSEWAAITLSVESFDRIVRGLPETVMPVLDNVADGMEDIGDKSAEAEPKVTSFLDGINRDIDSPMTAFIEDLEWMINTGGDAEQVFALIKTALDKEAITEGEAKAFTEEVLVAVLGVQTSMDDLTAEAAAAKIASTLGVSLEAATLMIEGTGGLDESLKGLADISFEITSLIEAKQMGSDFLSAVQTLANKPEWTVNVHTIYTSEGDPPNTGSGGGGTGGGGTGGTTGGGTGGTTGGTTGGGHQGPPGAPPPGTTVAGDYIVNVFPETPEDLASLLGL